MKETNNGIVGGSAGSLGEATMSDLRQGYTRQPCGEQVNEMLEEAYDSNHAEEEEVEPLVGFAGRPNGYER